MHVASPTYWIDTPGLSSSIASVVVSIFRMVKRFFESVYKILKKMLGLSDVA